MLIIVFCQFRTYHLRKFFNALLYIYFPGVLVCFFFRDKKNGKMIDSYFSLRPNVTVSCVVCGDLPRHSVRPPCLSLNILCLFHHCLQAFYFSDHLVSSLLLLYLFFIVSSPPKPGYLVLLIGFLFFFIYQWHRNARCTPTRDRQRSSQLFPPGRVSHSMSVRFSK